MANQRSPNSWFVDTSSSAGTASSFLTEKNLKLVGVIYHTNAGSDVLDIYDLSFSSTAAGTKKLSLKNSTAGTTQIFRLSDLPISFPNGIWVTLTGTPVATLILTQNSGNN